MTRYTRGLRLLPALALILALFQPRHAEAASDIKMTFQIVRELSEADRNALERTLEIDDREVPGMTAMAQRQIIRTLLAVSRSERMRVGKLVIGILPLPSADFTIEPADSPLGEEHNALLQAIKNKAAEGRVDPHKLEQKK